MALRHSCPQIHGGGHEMGLRSGALATHQIAGMGKAAQLAIKQAADEQRRQFQHAQILLDSIKSTDHIKLNAEATQRVPCIINLTIKGVESESLIASVPNIAFSNGSACTSQTIEPSHVLTGIGLQDEESHQSIRLSLGRFTTAAQIKTAGKILASAIRELRAISLY